MSSKAKHGFVKYMYKIHPSEENARVNACSACFVQAIKDILDAETTTSQDKNKENTNNSPALVLDLNQLVSLQQNNINIIVLLRCLLTFEDDIHLLPSFLLFSG